LLLDRRRFLVGAGAAIAGAVGAAPQSHAAEPFHITQGSFAVSVISDGHLVLPTRFLAPEIPSPEREAAFQSGERGQEQYASPTNVTLIRAGAELILVDAGSGSHFMPTAGKLAANLEAAGIRREAITQIVFTHGHPDHLWGTIDDLDDLTFPQARYVVAAAEWNFWQGDNALNGLPADRAGFVTGARRNYARIKNKVQMVKPGDEITPGIRVVDSSGHTQGHVSLEIAGADGLIIGGDALTHPVISFAHPQWRPAADHEPERAVQTRRRLLDRLATDRSKLIGFHLPYPGLGTVERKDGAFRFVPAT